MAVDAQTATSGHDADTAVVVTAGLTGLDEAEAQRRLAQHGPNAVAGKRSRGMVDIVRGILREPMFLLLLAAAGLYLVLGDIGEGLFMTAGAVVTIGLVVLQEARSERALAALRELAEPFARVIRGGIERRVPARDLVPGDLVLIGEGERLPADGLLIAGDALTVDESALTGESVPVSKRPRRPIGPGWRSRAGGRRHALPVRRDPERARAGHGSCPAHWSLDAAGAHRRLAGRHRG